MLNVSVIHTGSFKEKYLEEAFQEYTKRISGLARFEDICLKEKLLSDNPSQSEIQKALEEEGREILSRLDPRAKKIALCVEGKGMSSEELAKVFADAPLEGYSKIVFIIGSSYGLSDEVKKTADIRLSFSRMTFPHQLMRVILSEQIYRALMINKGSKYHK